MKNVAARDSVWINSKIKRIGYRTLGSDLHMTRLCIFLSAEMGIDLPKDVKRIPLGILRFRQRRFRCQVSAKKMVSVFRCRVSGKIRVKSENNENMRSLWLLISKDTALVTEGLTPDTRNLTPQRSSRSHPVVVRC